MYLNILITVLILFHKEVNFSLVSFWRYLFLSKFVSVGSFLHFSLYLHIMFIGMVPYIFYET
jgi:hypothetical protein